MATARLAFYAKVDGARRATGFRPGDTVPDDIAADLDPSLLTDADQESKAEEFADEARANEGTKQADDDLSDVDLDELEDDEDAEDGDPFDPAEHDVKGVLAYLEGTPPAEYDRVIAAEEDGLARKGVLGH